MTRDIASLGLVNRECWCGSWLRTWLLLCVQLKQATMLAACRSVMSTLGMAALKEAALALPSMRSKPALMQV